MESYIIRNNQMIKMTKWIRFKMQIQRWLRRFQLVDTWKYYLTPISDRKYYFKLSNKEYASAMEIYKNKGTISYEFCPGAIGWGVNVKVLKTGEVIDITDYSLW